MGQLENHSRSAHAIAGASVRARSIEIPRTINGYAGPRVRSILPAGEVVEHSKCLGLCRSQWE